MYDPNDKYIQEQIKKAIRIIKDVQDESTDCLQTTEDICKKLRDECIIDAWPKYD